MLSVEVENTLMNKPGDLISLNISLNKAGNRKRGRPKRPATATSEMSETNFFNISASSLTSKWVGDSEKMVKTLFAVAKYIQPTVIFIDEIDSLLTARSDNDSDSIRRLKTEFLIQFDGAATSSEDKVTIIGATNLPQSK